MKCRDCGEDFEGDGYTIPFHCPNAEDISGIEPDANPVNCGGADEQSNSHDSCRSGAQG